MDADNILVLDDGRIVGEGKHEYLLKNCKLYRDIALSQFKRGGDRIMNNDEIIKSPNETPRKGLDIGSALGVGGPQVQAKVKKAEDFKGTMKRLLKYLKPHYPQLIAMILIAGVGAWFAVWAPDVMKKITNHLVESIQFFKDVDWDMCPT